MCVRFDGQENFKKLGPNREVGEAEHARRARCQTLRNTIGDAAIVYLSVSLCAGHKLQSLQFHSAFASNKRGLY